MAAIAITWSSFFHSADSFLFQVVKAGRPYAVSTVLNYLQMQ